MAKAITIQHIILNEFKTERTDKDMEDRMMMELKRAIGEMKFSDIADITVDPYATRYTILVSFKNEDICK